MLSRINEALFAKIKATDRDTLAEGVQQIEHLDPEEHAKRSRAESFQAERHWKRKILPVLNWIALGVILSVAISMIIALGILLFSYLYDIFDDTEQKLFLLRKIVEVALISGATLYAESKLSRK